MASTLGHLKGTAVLHPQPSGLHLRPRWQSRAAGGQPPAQVLACVEAMTALHSPGPLTLHCARGSIRCVYHALPATDAAVVMVGGTDGGVDGPADALYPDLAADLGAVGAAVLRVDFRLHRAPGDVDEGVYDVRNGIAFLREQGIQRVGLLGHSFGGAVVIAAAVEEPAVTAVATLATQTAGALRVGALAPRPVLFVHGLDDQRLSPDCSRLLYRLAGEPKRIELLPGARHSLRQRREDVRRMLRDWFRETLVRRAADAAGQ